VLSRLYAICDAEVCARAGWTLPDYTAACMDGGATLLQLRAKRAESRDFLAAAEAVVERAAAYGAIIVINDRADIARLSGAGGVHVGQDDLAPADVRTLVGGSSLIGLSTHTGEQLAAAIESPIDYVAVGPVFGTRTKDTACEPVGVEMVRHAAVVVALRQLPIVAIGGITLERAPEVVAAGAASVAVITDLLAEDDPAARVRAFLDRLSRV
jgi:thiamine-phosphate pyrophosphorylase